MGVYYKVLPLCWAHSLHIRCSNEQSRGKSSPYEATGEAGTQTNGERNKHIHTYMCVHKLHSMTGGNIPIKTYSREEEVSTGLVRFEVLKC